MSSGGDILTAFRHSERALAEQIAEWEALEFGVAFTSPRFPLLPEANQLREVWLAEIDGEAAWQRAEAFYTDRGLTCRAWTPASGQSSEPVESLLSANGWKRDETKIFALADWNAAPSATPTIVRVLPARAMRKAYRATFDESTEEGRQSAEAAMERLNDPDLDAFVAMQDGKPAGRLSYFSVGDIARLTDLHIIKGLDSNQVGANLLDHALQLARRLAPKAVVATAPDSEVAFTRHGFVEANQATVFIRP